MRVKLVTTTKKTPNYLIYYLLIYGCWDFTAAGGLSPVAASRGYSVVAVREFLMAVASRCGARTPGARASGVAALGFRSCGAWA